GTVAYGCCVANDSCVTASRAEQPVHGDTLGQIAESVRGIFDIAEVKVEHRDLGVRIPCLGDKGGDAGQSCDAAMDVVAVEQDEALHRISIPAISRGR